LEKVLPKKSPYNDIDIAIVEVPTPNRFAHKQTAQLRRSVHYSRVKEPFSEGVSRRFHTHAVHNKLEPFQMAGFILGALAAGAGGLAAMKVGGIGGGSPGTTLSANKSLVKKLYREVWNQADKAKAKAAAAKFISEEHILIDPRRVHSPLPLHVSLHLKSSPPPSSPPASHLCVTL
jgi:hypothetical protein